MAEIESDSDDETRSLKHFNKDLKFINQFDKKPALRSVPEFKTELPVRMKEREIMESIESNLVTVICGETGSGKSTQTPKFLYEYGYGASTRPGMIGIT